MPYTFKQYDILQSANGKDGAWLDFSTLKDENDARLAVEIVKAQRFDGKPLGFRIVRHVPCEGHVPVLEG